MMVMMPWLDVACEQVVVVRLEEGRAGVAWRGIDMRVGALGDEVFSGSIPMAWVGRDRSGNVVMDY